VVGITTRLVERLLAAYPNAIAGIKDSSGDWNNTKTFLDAFVRDRRETISKSQTPSSKSQGSFKIQHSKGEAAFGARRGGDVDNDGSFDVFVGSESFLLANMRYGGVGTISATANVNPAAIHELCTEWKNQDADEQQAKLNVVRQVFSSRKFPSMIATLKQAIAIYAEDPAWAKVRPPLVELTPEQANTLSEELKAIGFEMELKRKKEEGRIKEK
jgi:4-hydroxy-tetrahydrodipicolinate synthase